MLLKKYPNIYQVKIIPSYLIVKWHGYIRGIPSLNIDTQKINTKYIATPLPLLQPAAILTQLDNGTHHYWLGCPVQGEYTRMAEI